VAGLRTRLDLISEHVRVYHKSHGCIPVRWTMHGRERLGETRRVRSPATTE
jgi:hypothetical protein